MGEGLPVAAAVNVALLPAVAATANGCSVMTGTVLTARVATVLVALPVTLVKTASYLKA